MSQFISLPDAIDLTTTHRENMETVLGTNYQNEDILPICETFDRSHFDYVLGQTDCEKLRIYFGMNSSFQVCLVIAGVNSTDEDQIPGSGNSFKLIEGGDRTPPVSIATSALNS